MSTRQRKWSTSSQIRKFIPYSRFEPEISWRKVQSKSSRKKFIYIDVLVDEIFTYILHIELFWFTASSRIYRSTIIRVILRFTKVFEITFLMKCFRIHWISQLLYREKEVKKKNLFKIMTIIVHTAIILLLLLPKKK